MKGENKMFRKIFVTLTMLMMFIGSVSAAPYITPEQEQIAGKGQMDLSRVSYVPEVPALTQIQNTIMAKNPSLKHYVSDSVRGIHPVHLLVTKNQQVNAHSLPGGHIFLSDALVKAFMYKSYNPYTGKTSGVEKTLGNAYEIYGHSAIAATMAHEFAHWERNFFQGEVDVLDKFMNEPSKKAVYGMLYRGNGAGFVGELNGLAKTSAALKSIQQYVYNEEVQADLKALEYLDRTDEYSTGSLIYLFNRLKDETTASLTPHPTAAVRSVAVRNHIKTISNGRVTLDESGRMSLDGKLFLGTGYLPERSDVTNYDRTSYVAGQLAKCVRYNAKAVYPLSEYAKAGNMVPFVAKGSGRSIVLDKFAITQDEAIKMEKGGSIERQAIYEIVKFLSK